MAFNLFKRKPSAVVLDRDEVHERKMQALQTAWAEAKKDKDYTSSLKELHQFQLKEIEFDRGLGISHVRIRSFGAGGNCCDACTAYSGRIFNLDNELKKSHLPVEGCTCTAYEANQTGFCLCNYDPVFDEEL